MTDSDFSDSGEEDIPLSQHPRLHTVASINHDDDDDGGYRMKGALKAPRPTSYTTQALFDQMIAGDIDTEPDYQRDVVWPESKQMGLIDSIFRNFYVPPLIFAVSYRDDGSERRVSIDGKQRLTSLRRFMQGEICFKDPHTGEKFVYEDIGKFKKIRILPDKYRKIFRVKQIVCIEYQDISNASEREIFQRVQLGMALTPSERLQAVASPISDFIRSLQEACVSPSDGPGLAPLLDWDTSRGADFRCLLHSVYMLVRWPNVPTFPTSQTLHKFIEREDELDPRFMASARQTFEIFLALARDKERELAGRGLKVAEAKKMAPVEVIAISVMIHAWKGRLSATQICQAVRKMRAGIRAQEQDIRANKRVMTILVDFVKAITPEQYLNGSNEPPLTKLKPLKRKRKGEDDDDDDAMSLDENRKLQKRKVETKIKEESSLPSVSQAHAMAMERVPTPSRPLSRPVAPPTPVSVSSSTSSAPAAPSPPARDRLAVLRAAKQLGTDIPSSQTFPSQSPPVSFQPATPRPPPYLSAPTSVSQFYTYTPPPTQHPLPPATLPRTLGQHPPPPPGSQPYTEPSDLLGDASMARMALTQHQPQTTNRNGNVYAMHSHSHPPVAGSSSSAMPYGNEYHPPTQPYRR